MTDVTQILNAIQKGDPSASDQLLPLVYEELRMLARQRLANEKPGQTLQATALVHEAYLRLVGKEDDQNWDNRGHFFAAAAEAMRRILIDRARRRIRPKHGGKRKRVDLDSMFPLLTAPPESLIAFDEVMTDFATREPEKVRLIELRYYGGCSLADAALAMGISESTAKRYWAYSRAWLFNALTEKNE
jgi:RNA polymerase sigma factor (TIGR02999 family)